MNASAIQVIRAAISRPGRLFQPVYVSPLGEGGAVAEEAAVAAHEHGASVYSGFEAWKFAGFPEAVVVIGPTDIDRMATHRPEGRIQVVAWGPATHALSPHSKEWIDERGVVVEPFLGGHEDSVSLTHVARGLERAEKGLYVILTAEGAETAVSQNLRIRLEAVGKNIAPTIPSETEFDTAILRVTKGSNRMEAAANVAAADPGEHLVVVISNAAAWDLAAKAQTWAEKARVLPLELISTAKIEEDGTWPSLASVLSPLPAVMGTMLSRPGQSWTQWSPDGDMEIVNQLQMAARPKSNSDITVFHDRGWARILVRGQDVARIDMAGDRWNAESLAKVRRIGKRGDDAPARLHPDMIVDRLKRVVQWDEGRVIVSKVTDDGVKGVIGAGGLVLDLVGWVDEIRDKPRRKGGTVWKSAGRPPRGDALNIALQIWELADGRRTSWQIDDLLGFGRERILDILASMELSGQVKAVGEEDVSEEPSAEEVAYGLLLSGLVTEAKSLLERTKESGRLTGAGNALYAAIIAITDGPREAVPFMRYAVSAVKDTEWMALRMDLAVLMARSGANAKETWESLKADLSSRTGIMGQGWGYRHYAAFGEVALRAGEAGQAKRVIRDLRGAPVPMAASIGQKLEQKLAELARK